MADTTAPLKRQVLGSRAIWPILALGVILTADTHTSDPVSVAYYVELDAILVVVIGALVIQALTTSILILGLPPEYNLIIKALVVLFVLVLQSDNARQSLLSKLKRGR